MSKSNLIAKATGLLVIITLASKITGFLREMAIAKTFGASSVTDAFLVAYTVPSLIFIVFGYALTTVIVPIYSKYSVQNKKEVLNKTFSILFNIVFIFLTVLTIIGMYFSPIIIKLLAPGFSPDQAGIAQQLLQIMLPCLIFVAIASLLTGMLNANNIFGIGALGPVFQNLIIILTVFFLGKQFGISVLASAVLIGAVLSLLVLLPWMKRTSFQYKPVISFQDLGVREIFFTLIPIIAGVGITQFYLIIDRILASSMVEGSISALNFASKLILLPQGLFVAAISTAIFPTISMLASQGKKDELSSTLLGGMKFVLLFAFPAGVGLIILRQPIVELLFQRGAFDTVATAMTSSALFYFSFGLVGQCLNPILTRGFFAMQDTATPMKITIFTVIINLIFSLLLYKPMQYKGLALANSIAATINVLLLAGFLKFKLNELDLHDLVRSTGKIFISTLILGVVVYFVDFELSRLHVALVVKLGVDILAGLFTFLFVGSLLRFEEFNYALSLINKAYNRFKGYKNSHQF
jgi:putative peptidoglycan lipid II flippase